MSYGQTHVMTSHSKLAFVPQIRTVEPKSSPLGSLVEVGGYRMFWDYKHYEQFFVGREVCELRNKVDNDHYGIRWRWPLHLVKCLVSEQLTGGWNASVTINHWRGRTWNHSQALYPVYDWSLAMYELFPGRCTLAWVSVCLCICKDTP